MSDDEQRQWISYDPAQFGFAAWPSESVQTVKVTNKAHELLDGFDGVKDYIQGMFLHDDNWNGPGEAYGFWSDFTIFRNGHMITSEYGATSGGTIDEASGEYVGGVRDATLYILMNDER